MKKYLLIVSFFFVISASNADILDNASQKISKIAADLIPGEGVTEVSIDIEKNSEPNFNILAVRDIEKTENTNFFTQISFSNVDVSGQERYIGNVGLGYRFLTDDESMMIGFNSFYDSDLTEGHKRASIGFEAKASTLEFNFNQYHALSQMQKVKTEKGPTIEEQALGGLDYRFASQLPYMPWAEISWKGYQIESDKASDNIKGDIYSLGLALTPTLQLDLSKDQGSTGAEDVQGGKLSFIYPPRESKPTLLDGFSDEVWFEESMQNKLSQKVERNNNLTVEIQGAVIFTKK